MSDVRTWLEAIGLAQYADAFEANDINMDPLRQVDDQMLKDFGVAGGGHRLRIRGALAELSPPPAPEASATTNATVREAAAASAERREVTVMFCDLWVRLRSPPSSIPSAAALRRNSLASR